MTKPFDPHAKDWKDHLARLNLSPIPEPRITPAMVRRLLRAAERGTALHGWSTTKEADALLAKTLTDWATRENKRTK